eukprot:gene2996-1978_t
MLAVDLCKCRCRYGNGPIWWMGVMCLVLRERPDRPWMFLGVLLRWLSGCGKLHVVVERWPFDLLSFRGAVPFARALLRVFGVLMVYSSFGVLVAEVVWFAWILCGVVAILKLSGSIRKGLDLTFLWLHCVGMMVIWLVLECAVLELWGRRVEFACETSGSIVVAVTCRFLVAIVHWCRGCFRRGVVLGLAVAAFPEDYTVGFVDFDCGVLYELRGDFGFNPILKFPGNAHVDVI